MSHVANIVTGNDIVDLSTTHSKYPLTNPTYRITP